MLLFLLSLVVQNVLFNADFLLAMLVANKSLFAALSVFLFPLALLNAKMLFMPAKA